MEFGTQQFNKVVGNVDFLVDTAKETIQFKRQTDNGTYFGGTTFIWNNILDDTATPLGTDLATTVTALRGLFFLTSGGGSFDLSNVFDLVKSDANFFDVTPSGNIISYPSIYNTQWTGIFFKSTITKMEWTINNDTTNWAILGGSNASYSGIAWDYAFKDTREFTPPGVSSAFAMPAPLVNYTGYTRFQLEWDGTFYNYYGWNGAAFVLLYAPFNGSTGNLINLVGCQTNHQLGISSGSVPNLTGILMQDVLLNDTPITQLL